MNPRIKIAGLGRQVIQQLQRFVAQDLERSGQPVVQIDHYPLPDPPPFSSLESRHLSGVTSMPFLAEQADFLTRANEYVACILEISPPVRPFVHEKPLLQVCVEVPAGEQEGMGFLPHDQITLGTEICEDAHAYVDSLTRLVQRLRDANRNIIIVLLNATLLFEEPEKPVGPPLLHEVMKEIRTRLLLPDEDLALLDVDRILEDLSKKATAFFDTEFPFFSVIHDEHSNPVAITRDCEQTSPYMYRKMLLGLYNVLLSKGFKLPSVGPVIDDRPVLARAYSTRAEIFLQDFFASRTRPLQLYDAWIFARFTWYTLATDSEPGHSSVVRFIDSFTQSFPKSLADLQTYYNHIKTITAYLFLHQKPMLVGLSIMGIRLLNLGRENLESNLPLASLWLKHISLAARSMLAANPHLSPQHFDIFQQKLATTPYLQCFRENQLLSQGIPRSGNQHFRHPKTSPQVLKRIAIFFPRSTPLYMSMFFGLKRGFESLGIEVSGWSELLKEDALLEFCRQFKPDAIFEMNRSRHMVPSLPKEIIHICWLVDLMGHDHSFFKGSDIIYSFGLFWPQIFAQNCTAFSDWLPPGVDPACYYYEKKDKISDFSFVGHIPLPWNTSDLNRTILETKSGRKTFGDFMSLYDRLWKHALKQPTPPEIIHELIGTPRTEYTQEIDIDNLTLRYDILYRSRRIKIRQSTIDSVMPISRNIRIYGSDNWQKWPEYNPFYQRFIDNPHELRDIYQSTRLNLHEGVSLHMRLLDCLASGGCLLYVAPDERTNTGKGIQFFFEEGVHYFRADKADFEYQVREYLRNEKLCDQIRLEAARIIHTHHTWRHRAQKILDDFLLIRA